MIEQIKQSLLDASATLNQFMDNEQNICTIGDIVKLLARTFSKGGKVIIFGNGGSMCDAMHFAEELTGRFRNDRSPFPAIAISDPSHITCVANDYGFNQIFARAISAYAKPDDVVIGISTSGNSPNVINAMQTAQQKHCFTIALLGMNGGLLRHTCDYELTVEAQTSDRIQEVHMAVLHTIVEMVERVMAEGGE
ncbi:MAG: SIS domain-containing protein [Candidatus Cloacimonetes bacterium]|nr:SIS domain-containing protein [Candidatus Cloacimonadota bacterium]